MIIYIIEIFLFFFNLIVYPSFNLFIFICKFKLKYFINKFYYIKLIFVFNK